MLEIKIYDQSIENEILRLAKEAEISPEQFTKEILREVCKNRIVVLPKDLSPKGFQG